MNIRRVDNNNFDQVIEFLSEIKKIKIDENIVRNASVVYDSDDEKEDNKIIGILSFEKFSNVGLIRYFVFKKSIKEDELIELFESTKKVAREQEIKKMICIIENEDMSGIFKFLKFKRLKDVYFEEEKISQNILTYGINI